MIGRTLLSVLSMLGLRSEQKELSADELKDLQEKKARLCYLDVREPWEIDELGTLEGYVNIPISQLENRAGEIPRGVPIVAY